MIELQEVVKEYATGGPLGRDRVRALDGVTLEVEPGTALGIVGLNGAGKSTLIRLLLGYVRPTQGTAAINGMPPRQYVERHGIAYVPERVSVPPGWTVRRALRAFAMLAEVPGNAWENVDRALDRLGLLPLSDRRVGALSKGNLQRLVIAQAILADRALMVLDEPTEGLDPVWIAEFRDIIAEWRAADPERIVLLASHTLPEVERLVDRVLLLHNGRIAGELEHGAGAERLESTFLRRVSELPEPRP